MSLFFTLLFIHLFLVTYGKHFKAATHKIKANNGTRKAKDASAALPAPLASQASMPLGGLSSDLTMTPCEGEQCSDQISYDKVEFDKKGWSTPKWCHGCKKARNAARLAANNAGPGSAAGGGNSNLSVDTGNAEDAADSDDELAKSLAEADGGKVVHFELFGDGNLAIGESVGCDGYDSDDVLANSVNAAEPRKATFQWADLPSESHAVKSDTTLKAPGCDTCNMSVEMAEAIVECEQQDAACKLKTGLEDAELALENRAADSFAIPSTDGQGETLEELNRPCPWITADADDDQPECGELEACAMLAGVEPPVVVYSCSGCGGPPGEQGLCDGEC